MKAEAKCGDGIIEQLSLDLKDTFPGVSGFSSRNLRSIRQWYKFYSPILVKWPQLVAKIPTSAKWPQLAAKTWENEERMQTADELHYPAIFSLLPWSSQRLIVSKCKSAEEGLFYVVKTIDVNWSRSVLENFIESDLYHSQGSLPSNFDKTLPVNLWFRGHHIL